MMNEKVILISVDGMRPDGITACGNDYLLKLAAQGASCLDASTIMPSVTLPCHSSLFFQVLRGGSLGSKLTLAIRN